MCLFRVVVGFLAFCNIILLSVDFETWFTEKGLFPLWMAERWNMGQPRFNPLVTFASDQLTLVVFVLTGIAALTTCLGLFSRVSSVVLFLCTIALHHRSPDILHSGDTLIRQWCFLLMFMPSGAMYSLDRRWGLAKTTAEGNVPEASVWPQRMVQYQLAIVYFTTVWHKAMGPYWREGIATYFPPRLDEFDRFPVPAFMNEVPMVYVTTYGTLAVELALATLVFARPLRNWVLLAGLLMHIYIEYSMNIPLFAFVMLAGYICHFESDEVMAFVTKWKGKWQDRVKPQEGATV